MASQETGQLIPYLAEMFRYQAWIAMGKVANPATGKVDRDLTVARGIIDLCAELETKTEGNRSDDESKVLQGVLTELRLNFLDESKKPDPQPAEDAAADGESSEDAPTAGASEPEPEPEKSS